MRKSALTGALEITGIFSRLPDFSECFSATQAGCRVRVIVKRIRIIIDVGLVAARCIARNIRTSALITSDVVRPLAISTHWYVCRLTDAFKGTRSSFLPKSIRFSTLV